MYRASNSWGVMRALVPVLAPGLLILPTAAAPANAPQQPALQARDEPLARDLDEDASPGGQRGAFQPAATERLSTVAQPTTDHHRGPLTNRMLPGHHAMASVQAATPLPITLSPAGLTAAATPRRVRP